MSAELNRLREVELQYMSMVNTKYVSSADKTEVSTDSLHTADCLFETGDFHAACLTARRNTSIFPLELGEVGISAGSFPTGLLESPGS